jgi:hypothetical protein
MGAPMVSCLIEAGHRPTVYDIRREEAMAGAELRADVGEVAGDQTDDPRRLPPRHSRESGKPGMLYTGEGALDPRLRGGDDREGEA